MMSLLTGLGIILGMIATRLLIDYILWRNGTSISKIGKDQAAKEQAFKDKLSAELAPQLAKTEKAEAKNRQINKEIREIQANTRAIEAQTHQIKKRNRSDSEE